MIALLIDSDAALRAVRARALMARGWGVQDFGSVAEGMTVVATLPRLDLVVTEALFAAGGATGFDLREAARARFPGVRVLFTSRFDLTDYEAVVGGALVLMDAPEAYDPGELIEAVNGVMKTPVEAQALRVEAVRGPLLEPGMQLGNYEIREVVRSDDSTETYRALQHGVERVVGLVLLRPEHALVPERMAQFLARERTKASLNHPRIAPLYEAGEEAGYHFYTREVPRGRSLREITTAGEMLNERALVELIHGVAEVMQYATERGLRYREISDWDIYLDEDYQASLVNIFRPPGDGSELGDAEQVAEFLRLLRGRVAGGKAAGLLQSLSQVGHDWASLHEEMRGVREALREHSIQHRIEKDTTLMREHAARRAVPGWVWAAAVAVLVVVAVLGALTGNPARPVTDSLQEEMVPVPAGPFVYQNGEKRTLPVFWISRTEVTVGQYAAFLEALKGAVTRYDHPNQPKAKATHAPADWDELLEAARTGAMVSGEKVTLDTPVTGVDWWDAYAYSKWKGYRLPTEEEWEKAARGISGNLYPWGNQWLEDAANTGADYHAGGAGGKKDGFNLWAPTNRETSDVSPFGIRDMAGNVQEWTAGEKAGELWAEHPEIPDLRVPVVRGGHFGGVASDQVLTGRLFVESAQETTPARGFRVASDRAPGT